MAQYPLSTHSLHFSKDYTTLSVVSNGHDVDSFDLDENTRAVKVGVRDGEFHIDYADPLSENELPHWYDISNGTSVSFNHHRLGGVGIVDLKDMGRKGDFTVEYDLDGNHLRLAHAVNPIGLWVKPMRPDSFSFDEN